MIRRIQGNKKGNAFSTSLSLTLDSAPANGNFLVAVVGTSNSTPPTVSSISQSNVSWSKQVSNSSSSLYGRNIEIWAGTVSTGASANLMISLTASGIVYADVCEYRGVLTSGFLDKTYTAAGTNTRNLTTGTTPLTTALNELWIGGIFNICDIADSGNSTLPTNGFTLLDGIEPPGANCSLSYLEKIVDTTGAASSNVTGATFTTYEGYIGCIATFRAADVVTMEITASASPNCTISPSGLVEVDEGEDQAFTITAATGYHVTHVYVDGIDQGALGSYTFTDLDSNHTIFAATEVDPTTYSITAVADTNSAILPSGIVTVTAGDDQEFTVTANPSYHITHLYVDFVDHGAIGTYLFEDVTANHVIFVTSESDDAYAPAFELNGNLTVNGGTELSGNAIIDGNVQAAAYKASDGTAGATSNVSLAGVTTLQFKNGLLVGTS